MHASRGAHHMFALLYIYFQNILPLIQSDYMLRLFFDIYFIGDIHPLYTPPSTIIVLSEKHKSIFSSDNISCTCIISYLCLRCKSSTWKLHVTMFVTSILVSKIFTLLVLLVLKPHPCVFKWP